MANEKNLVKRIELLEARNKRVDADKAWETSWIRKILIMILTYLVVISYLHFVVHINPWINGFVPVIGYFLSTQTISIVKKRWIQKRKNI
jgi:uncharacterized membrane-anchored protein